MKENDTALLEIGLFDRWVLERREGKTPDLDAMAELLPEERRESFKFLCRSTAALQAVAGVDPARPNGA